MREEIRWALITLPVVLVIAVLWARFIIHNWWAVLYFMAGSLTVSVFKIVRAYRRES